MSDCVRVELGRMPRDLPVSVREGRRARRWLGALSPLLCLPAAVDVRGGYVCVLSGRFAKQRLVSHPACARSRSVCMGLCHMA